jgi:cell division septal protein FtsQ
MKARSQAKLKRQRRYDSEGLAGAWEARPRFHRRSLPWRWMIGGAIGLMLIGAVLYFFFGDMFYITRVSIGGNLGTSAQEILQISDVGGQHILWVDTQKAAERIVNGIPSIKQARVECQLPDRCSIKVQERQPSVAWQFGGAVTWIADDGMAFAAQARPGKEVKPIVINAPQGPALLPGKEADRRIVTAALAVANALPDVREYTYTDAHGLEFQSGQGYAVYLGLGENMADRAMLWKAVEAELVKQGVTPKFVDLRYPSAPYFVRNDQ